MSKRNKGFLVPEIINPPGRRCVQLWIPDEQTHIANFWGVLNFLTLWTEYEKTGNNNGALTADVWKEVFLTAREYFEANEGCYLPLELRNNEGQIEWRPDPFAAWQSLGDICPCPPLLPSPQYNPDAPTFMQRSCNISVGIIDWLMAKFGDSIDAFEAAADGVAAFDAIWVIFLPGYIIADQLIDAINELVEVGVNAARAFDSETHRDEMKQFLYCEMGDTGELTAEIWESFIQFCADEYNNFANPGYGAWHTFMVMFDVEAVLTRARIESYEEHDCTEFDCTYDWEHITTFDSGTYQDWNVFDGRAMTPTVNGIEAGILTSGAVTRRQITLYNNMPYRDATTQITAMRFSYTNSAQGNSSPLTPDPSFGNMRIFSEPDGEGTILLNSGSKDIAAGDGFMNHDGFAYNVPANASLLWYAQFAQRNSAPNVTGAGNAWEFRIRGNGKNPFVP